MERLEDIEALVCASIIDGDDFFFPRLVLDALNDLSDGGFFVEHRDDDAEKWRMYGFGHERGFGLECDSERVMKISIMVYSAWRQVYMELLGIPRFFGL